MSSSSDLDVLRRRAYGPDQLPMTAEELARLRALETRDEAPLTVTKTEPTSQTRRNRWAILWLPVGMALIGVAALGGYAVGVGWPGSSSIREPLSDGVQLEDGTFRQFSDADCVPVFSTDDGSLSSVDCQWDDGAQIELPANE